MFFPFTKKWQARIEKLATDLFATSDLSKGFRLMPNQSAFNAKPISI